MKASVFVATSVDGFIARKDGTIDWLSSAGEAEGGEDYGYQAFMDAVDGLVMGRNTYETVRSFDAWPYGKKPVIVLSSRQVEIPEELAETVQWMDASPQDVAQRLSQNGLKHVYIDGGRTIQGFLKAGLIQQLIITRIPILIGEGTPLFGVLAHDIKLHLVETRHFKNGIVQTNYDVMDSKPGDIGSKTSAII